MEPAGQAAEYPAQGLRVEGDDEERNEREQREREQNPALRLSARVVQAPGRDGDEQASEREPACGSDDRGS